MKIDRLLGILTVLLKNENVTAPVLAGLRSLNSVDYISEYQLLLDKISPIESKSLNNNIYDASGNVVIDLASYYKGSFAIL